MIKFKKKMLFLAPLAGISDRSFREMYTKVVDYKYSEMISAKGLFYLNEKTLSYLNETKNEKNLIIQIFGDDLESLIFASKYIEKHTKAVCIDINMGCPVPKVYKTNGGSALLNSPEMIEEIIKTLKENVKIPISVKLRSGIDREHVNIIETAKACERGGASFITVHGRTRSEGFKGNVNLDDIKLAKENVNIPVIGNGDIKTLEDAVKMFSYTGCDAVMVGRSAISNPRLLYEISDYLKGKKTSATFSQEAFIYKHLKEIKKRYQNKYGLIQAKKVLVNGSKRFPNYKKFRNLIYPSKTIDEVIKIYKMMIGD